MHMHIHIPNPIKPSRARNGLESVMHRVMLICLVELGVIIGKKGRDIPADQALSYVSGYCVALDMTARNLQEEAKKGGDNQHM